MFEKLFHPEHNSKVELQKKPNNPAFVTSPGQIIRLLKILEDDRSLLTITIPERKGYFTSSIIAVKSEGVFLDKLTPALGHKLLMENKALKAFANLRGIKTSFQSTVIQSGDANGIPYYKCVLPGELYYPQKRQYHRCSMKGTGKISFQAAYGEEQEPLDGILYDISRGGIGVLIHDRIQIDSGEIFHGCRITLPCKNKIHFDLQITFCKKLPRSKKLRIGGYFLHLDVKSEQILGRFITQTEREEVRKLRA